MRQNQKVKIIAITALCLAVVGLTLGFAAFSNQLTISSSATVSPDSSDFKVVFSSSETEVIAGDLPVGLNGANDAEGNVATIVNGEKPTITGIGGTLKKAPTAIMYYVYIHNIGKYDAYLNKVIFNNVTDKDKSIVCTAVEGTSQTLVDSACENMSIRIWTTNDGNVLDSSTGNYLISIEETKKFNGEIKIAPGESHPINIILNYDDEVNSVLADGDFIVEFGDLSFEFSTTA